MSALDDLLAADIFTDAPECADTIERLADAATAERDNLIAVRDHAITQFGVLRDREAAVRRERDELAAALRLSKHGLHMDDHEACRCSQVRIRARSGRRPRQGDAARARRADRVPASIRRGWPAVAQRRA